ncbi:phosphatase 1 regulatory subunit 16A isoform X1 [Chlorella sorokiniana]|uniref:Phosphatase 1 regulatory subunit 16A isoform X1 n=1 Tax=Chlorella sorokiniana TaxID=3076 RepID=A0A2P6U5F9_CHLSO|nr:phosphatase 1 regulatory subunit 16A isoform X1 [Chlorella sorokiniana]|eukprot:PRW61551.1 phosphatase 1 regulatory subunit 16A isoform X1 [Chlorella sorokiniana]
MEAAQDEHKAVALLQAVLRGDEAAVHAALASGAPLKLDGLTALHAAALADWGSGVPLLLAAGAELDACTDFGHSDEVESAKLSSLAQLGLAAGQVAALGKWFYRRTPLEVAVAAGAAAAAEALLSAGASSAVFETLLDLAKRTAVQPGATAAAAVQEAVQRMAGQVVWWSACPIYALLEGFCNEWELVVEDECMKLDYGPAGVGPSEDGLQKLHADALALMDELAAAGYRPVTFRNYLEHYGPDARVLPTFYPPSDARREAAQWELATTSKWLWLAAQRGPAVRVALPAVTHQCKGLVLPHGNSHVSSSHKMTPYAKTS